MKVLLLGCYGTRSAGRHSDPQPRARAQMQKKEYMQDA